jgi:phage-related minor tail protein
VVTQIVLPEEAKILVTRLVCTWNATRMGQIPRLESESQSEELIQLQREERLVLDIIGETLRTDEQWCDYEDEETQVKLDLADMTLEKLMSETLSLLYALS